MMKLLLKSYNITGLFLLLFVAYNLQGSLYVSGGIISRFILILLFLIGGIYFIKCLLSSRKNFFFITWSLLIIINITYYIFSSNIVDKGSFELIKNILLCSMGFYPFYYFAYKGYDFKKIFILFLYSFLITSIFSFYRTVETVLLNTAIMDENHIVNNSAYLFVNLIPFLYFIKRNLCVKVCVLLLIVFYIIQGSKRGAIVTGGVGVVIYLYHLLKENKSIYQLLFICSCLIVVGYFSYSLFLNNEYLIVRMNMMLEGDSSGRDHIYTAIFNSWYNSENLLNILLGYGFTGSMLLSGEEYAHNDWLEVLADYGLLGEVIYLSLFILMLRECRSKYLTDRDRMILVTIFLIGFSTSLFSMWYFNGSTFTQSILLGYFWGRRNRILKNRNK